MKNYIAIYSSEIEEMVKDYYQEQGWDTRTGLPGRETLVKLGLDDI